MEQKRKGRICRIEENEKAVNFIKARYQADTAAKLGLELLDANNDGRISKDEAKTTVQSAIDEMNKANNDPNS